MSMPWFIQMSLLVSFWVWCLVVFAMRVTVGQIKCGPDSPEVQATAVCEISGVLLRLCFELVSQICNSRNPVKHPQLGQHGHSWNCDAGTCQCSAMLCHSWAQLGLQGLAVWAALCRGHCSSVTAVCSAEPGLYDPGADVQASCLTSGMAIQSGLCANQGKRFSLISRHVCS